MGARSSSSTRSRSAPLAARSRRGRKVEALRHLGAYRKLVTAARLERGQAP